MSMGIALARFFKRPPVKMFNRGNFEKTNLSGIQLISQPYGDLYQKITHADFSFSDLHNATISYIYFSKCDFSNADLDNATLKHVRFFRCDFMGATMTNIKIRDVSFLGCSFCHTNLSGTNFPPPPAIFKRLKRTDEGFLVYKTFGEWHSPPEKWLPLEPGRVIEEWGVCPDRFTKCGSGINVSTLEYVLSQTDGEIWECLLRYEDIHTVVVPNQPAHLPKFRCARVQLIRRIERPEELIK